MFSMSIIPLSIGVNSRRLSILNLATLPLSLQEQVLRVDANQKNILFLSGTHTNDHV